jgi:small GTP-binding protein
LTLIGRLLHETDAILEDQLSAIEAASRRHGAPDQPVDLALLVDGLAAEREQGITIDVAYRYFTTHRRKFIIADTPGHEQYTRNMATGASTADLAILLVDARKGAAVQTRRHALIVSLIGVKHVIVAVNKMDLIDWSEDGFRRIEAQIRGFAASFGFESLSFIPLSALTGGNVAAPARRLLPLVYGTDPAGGARSCGAHGETLVVPHGGPVGESSERRFPRLFRPDHLGRRRGRGSDCGAALRRRDDGQVHPGAGGEQTDAVAGQSVTLVLADDIDISRGDLFTAPSAPAPS